MWFHSSFVLLYTFHNSSYYNANSNCYVKGQNMHNLAMPAYLEWPIIMLYFFVRWNDITLSAVGRFYVSNFVLSMCKMKANFVYWQFFTVIAFCTLFHLWLVHIPQWMPQPLVHYVSDIIVILNAADYKCMFYNN